MEKEASHENILMKTRAAVAAAGSEAQLRTIKTGAAIAQHLHRLEKDGNPGTRNRHTTPIPSLF